MNRLSRYGLLLIAGLGAVALLPQRPAPASEIQILPHSAVYRMELTALAAGSAVSAVVGRMEFEWQETCDAWTVSQRALMRVNYGDGTELDFGWTMNSWESKDGHSYRFFIRRLYNGGASEELRGKAELQPSRGGEAVFTKPDDRTLALPAETMFPTEHTKVLLTAARKGWPSTGSLWRPVFDGSGDSGLFGVSATMIESLGPEAGEGPGLDLVRELPSWRMRLAFFDLEQAQGQAPAHEQALRLYANGVVDELVLDYDEFSVRAILEDLKPVPAPTC